MDTAEFASQFHFRDGGSLSVWCEGKIHATGDDWLLEIPVTDLEGHANNRLLPIVEMPKGN